MSDPATTPSKYLAFERRGVSPSGKTERWDIMSKSQDSILASVYWYGAWRQYVIEPQPRTIFNRGCLEDICEFLRRMSSRG